MRYDGIYFRVAKNVVVLRDVKPDPVLSHGMDSYVVFGRILPSSAGAPSDAYLVKSHHRWNPDTHEYDRPVYARPIELDGYSLTNMAYGMDGRVYLAHDGACYQSKASPRKAAAYRELLKQRRVAARAQKAIEAETARLTKGSPFELFGPIELEVAA